MKMTLATMKKLVKNIENVTALCASEVELHEENSEYILRFCDGNNFTISCYVFENIFQIGYLLEDGTYKWYGDSKLTQFDSVADFMFFIGIKLKEVENYVENYVIA